MFTQLELRQVQIQLAIFFQWDNQTLAVIKNNYKTMQGNLRFLLLQELYSITSFHMKETGHNFV